MLDKLREWLPNRPRLKREIVDGELEPHADERRVPPDEIENSE